MAVSHAPKSILKKTTAASRPDATKTKAERDMEIALYHANLIQQQKDIAYTILESLEALIEYPLAPSHTAPNPSPVDTKNFKSMLKPFTTSDYDDLIEERNINNKCGYVLCEKANQKDGMGGRFRIAWSGRDTKIVEKRETEKWCSNECAKRALYVRVQLSERPAWERNAFEDAAIDLLDEPQISATKGIEQEMHKMKISADGQDQRNLSLERNNKTISSRSGLLADEIKENFGTGEVKAPSLGRTRELGERLDTLHLNLEGHTPKFDHTGERADGSDEDLDTDWKL
ncbi:Rtr1/RPAP2 family-domain-containing protein [Calycina marina]|uniref:RNA polymerase II subunit B1 CTD phosphatase RPAP2 homolog n=1 Tax=Calycina marina TaxID=1763456 RepID=A0A9P8CJQ2_9HELO|nr:Rtr1/RPAP2 family-domain-containing protein [Calycina marina]